MKKLCTCVRLQNGVAKHDPGWVRRLQPAPGASIPAADNSLYIKRELIFLVLHCLFGLCSEHSAAVGVLMHFEIFDV